MEDSISKCLRFCAELRDELNANVLEVGTVRTHGTRPIEDVAQATKSTVATYSNDLSFRHS